ncbi:hypothetical protein TNCV_2570291 [Trichonephila clavipes]|nr:hypothetical protein TNCV_2570291 [Trichonephila clavipes]
MAPTGSPITCLNEVCPKQCRYPSLAYPTDRYYSRVVTHAMIPFTISPQTTGHLSQSANCPYGHRGFLWWQERWNPSGLKPPQIAAASLHGQYLSHLPRENHNNF